MVHIMSELFPTTYEQQRSFLNQKVPGSKEPHYVAYTANDDATQDKEFMDQLRSTLEWSDRAKPLVNAIDKGDLKVRSFKATTDPDDHPRIYMFVCYQDHILIKLAHFCNMPRGFPTLFFPGKKIKFCGFRPKFDNDMKGEVPLELEADGVAWFKKLSGFLGQLLTWVCPLTGRRTWTTTSKNSANAAGEQIFARDAARLFQPFITNAVVDALEFEGAHVCAEVMSFQDQVHGADLIEETPIVTTMGVGSCLDLVHKKEVNGFQGKGYVKFWGFEQTIQFCVENGLPVSPAIMATGEAAKTFLRLIQENRDQMDDESYECILAKVKTMFPTHITFLEGNVTHREVLGLPLEGLVVHSVSGNPDASPKDILKMIEDGDSEVMKMKCPGYTGRTMGVRQGNDLSLVEFLTHIDKWAGRWCITEEGMEYWKDFYTEVWFRCHEDTDGDNLVAPHIRYSDQVKLEWASGNTAELRTALKARVFSLVEDGDVEPRGPVTLVVPFGQDADFMKIKSDLPQCTVGWTSKKEKKGEKTMVGDAKWWIRLVNLPPKTVDTNTGPVFCLPAIATQGWHTKKLENGTFEEEWMIQITSTDGLDSVVKEKFKQDTKTMMSKAKEENPLEQILRDLVNSNIPKVTAKCAELKKQGKKAIFMITGLQGLGKSTFCDKLVELGVKIVSADTFMGVVFKPELIVDCHHKCQLACLELSEQGFNVAVDNTNVKRGDCSIYESIAEATGAELVPIVLAPELWVNTTSDKRVKLVDLLENRCLIRETKTGKRIERTVIERTLGIALKDFKLTTGQNAGPDTTEEEILSWLSVYPKPTYTQGFVDERGTIMFRSPDITRTCMRSLEDSSRPKIKIERVRCMILRGKGEFHVTFLTPEESKYLKTIIPVTDIDVKCETYGNKAIIQIAKKSCYCSECSRFKFGTQLQEGGSKNAFHLVKSLLSMSPAVLEPNAHGVGSISNEDGDETIYEVFSWEWGQAFRKKLGFGEKDFHATLAWTGPNDFHTGKKGPETLM